MSEILVQSLRVYPIKSTAGVELSRADVEASGLAWDRRWTLVDADGEVITARDYPRLLEVRAFPGDDAVVVRHGEQDVMRLPLTMEEGSSMRVSVFGSPVDGIAVGGEADQWFSELIGTPARLIFMNDTGNRRLEAEHGGRVGDTVSFADQCPLLLISRASLEDLNSRLDRPVSMRNFRPNIVVSGCGPFQEDAWGRVEIAGVSFDVSQRCQRCVFTTIDPDTGGKHPQQEPLRTLSGYRRHPRGGVAFGVHLVPRGRGSLSRGDRVETR